MVYDSEWNSTLFEEEPLKKKLLRNWFRLYFFAFVAAPAWYVAKMIASHSLSVEDIWLFYSILWVISLLATYNDLGLTEALQYFLPHYLIDKEYGKAKAILVSTFYIQLISWVLIWGITFFIAPWLAVHYFKSANAIPILQMFSIYYLILNFFQVLQSVFIATQNVRRSQGIEAVRMWWVVIFVAIWAWTNTFSASHYAWFWLWWLLCATIICALWVYHHFSWIWKYKTEFNKKVLSKQRSYAFWIMIGTNATILLSAIDQQLALYFFGTRAAWYWTNYLSLLNIIHVISMPIIAYLFPLLNELHKKAQHDKIALINKLLYGGFTALWFVIGILFHFKWPQIATLFFWSNFIESGVLLQKAAPFIFLIPLVWMTFQNLASRGQAKQRVLVLILGICTTLLWSLIFINTFKLDWIIYGTACGQLIMICSALYLMKKNKPIAI